jgi:hypothetical protein
MNGPNTSSALNTMQLACFALEIASKAASKRSSADGPAPNANDHIRRSKSPHCSAEIVPLRELMRL